MNWNKHNGFYQNWPEIGAMFYINYTFICYCVIMLVGILLRIYCFERETLC